MYGNNLTLVDLVLTPIYAGVLFLVAKKYRDKRLAKDDPLRQYYLPGLIVKFGGAIFIGCVYEFYYGSGDTFNYYQFGNILNTSLGQSFDTWLKLFLRVPMDSDPYVYQQASQISFYTDPSTYMIVRISALLSLVSFNSYMCIAVLFAFISYTGIWAMFRTFTSVYPALHKPLSVAFLFVPSVFVWGSGIFKDTVCMFGLGWMTYTCFRIFVNKDFSAKNILLFAISLYLVGIVKVYILLAFLPSLAFWLLLTYSNRIKSAFLRASTILLVMGVFALSFFFFAQQFSEELNRYSLENITETVEVTRNYIVYSSGDEGSAYDLGTIDPTLIGMIQKFPAAVAVTLFRPFLWEVKKPIALLSALEGLAFLIMFILAFIRNGFFNTFGRIFRNPDLAFFFVYSVIFAFAVGISTGNFGTLSRYKIPCMPFFAALLVILLYQKSSKKDATQ